VPVEESLGVSEAQTLVYAVISANIAANDVDDDTRRGAFNLIKRSGAG
jgi:hypothetical protein